jgi:biopolymer transport protein ExbB
MNESWSLAQAWANGDAVSRAVALTLLLLSLASWSTMLGKLLSHWRISRSHAAAVNAFWNAANLASGRDALASHDRAELLLPLVDAAAQALAAHQRNGLAAGLSLSDSITRALRTAIVASQIKLESGLTLLATIGATAPFVGLLGTVWGIHHALTSLRGAAQMSIDRVAGPVGEALVMTAAGLFVALPAVLAYNALTRGNRIALMQLDGFAHDLHHYCATGHSLSGPLAASNAGLQPKWQALRSGAAA